MREFDSSKYTGLSGKDALIEEEMREFYCARMHELETLYQDQQNRDLKKDERAVVRLTTQPHVQHVENSKLSSKKAYALFRNISVRYNHLKENQQLATEQEAFKNYIEVAVRCARYLIKESVINSKAQRVFNVTQAMFIDYFALFPDDRETLRLHLNFRDILKDCGFKDEASLSGLLKDEGRETVSADIEGLELSQSAFDTVAAEVKQDANLYSIDELTERFKELSKGSSRLKVLNIELAKLSNDVAKFIYYNSEATDRKQHLGFALAVEAYRIEQMQLAPRENLRALVKSMQKSAKYFRILYNIYNNSAESAELKQEVKKAYQIMDARANNYEQMLACSFIEKSEVTSGAEKKRAYTRRMQYKLENTLDIEELCARYRNLTNDYGPEIFNQESFDKLSSEDKYKLISLQSFNTADFDLLQKSRAYLLDIQCQFLANLQETSVVLAEDLMVTKESLQDIDLLPMHTLHIDALLNSELGKTLQEAITLHFTIKSKYFKQLLNQNPSVAFVKNEYFCADFRLQSYEFLFAACMDEDRPENLELVERNCWDIINAGENSTSILIMLARYKLDILMQLHADIVEEDLVNASESEVISDNPLQVTYQTQQALTLSPRSLKVDAETNWSQLCESHEVRSICFSTYLDKINSGADIDQETADFLYEAVTDRDKPLLVDEHNIDMFYELYGKLVSNFYVPKEFESLEYSVAENITQGREGKLISSDKLMVKALDIHDEVLKYIRMYRPELQLKVILSQINIFYKMRRVVPKREFLVRCENALKDAQDCIHLEQDLQAKISTLNLIKKIREIVKNAPLEKDKQTCLATDSYMLKAYEEKSAELRAKAENVAKQPRKITQRVTDAKYAFNQHTTLSQIRGILHVALRHDLGVWQKVLPILYSVNAQLDFLTHLQYWHMAFINDTYLRSEQSRDGLPESKAEVMLNWFNIHYSINLTYYAKLAAMLDEERHALQIQIVAHIPNWLEEAQENRERNFAIYGAKIAEFGELSTDIPTFTQARQNILSVLDLDIPEELYIDKNISTDCQRAIQFLKGKHYWQAMYLLASDDSAFACFIKASILHWAYKIICATSFANTLVENDMILQSLNFTQQAFEKEIGRLIAKVKTDSSLREPFKKLKNFKTAGLEDCSVFARRLDELVVESSEEGTMSDKLSLASSNRR